MIKRCEVCGREFPAKRSTARFCSATCRSRYARGYAYAGEMLPPAPGAALSDDEVLEVLRRAHDVAADLSRASMLTPSPLCLSLAKVARRLEEALRGEGL